MCLFTSQSHYCSLWLLWALDWTHDLLFSSSWSFTTMYECNTDSKMGNYNALLFLTLPSQDALLAAYLTQAMQLHRNASNRHVLVVRIEKDACRGVVWGWSCSLNDGSPKLFQFVSKDKAKVVVKCFIYLHKTYTIKRVSTRNSKGSKVLLCGVSVDRLKCGPKLGNK